ncbi:MAG TPA: hypothetical protein GX719_06105 [Gammaproteobacteria bacterium]|nr:hypothetical protein [Gammaproteobacteria bacterium]
MTCYALRRLQVVFLLFTMLFSTFSLAEEVSRTEVLKFNIHKIMSTLSDALKFHDEIPTLEDSKLIGRDKKSAQSDMNKLISKAIGLFESEKINQLRQTYRQLEIRIADENSKINQYRAERVLAVREEPSTRAKLLPGETMKSWVAVSKGDYDKLIVMAQSNLASYEESRAGVLEEMHSALSAIGMELSEEQLHVLLSSVTGDSVLEMSVVFNAIKDMTEKLAELTSASDEDLGYAKKYYGMVVVLHSLTVTMQQKFITDIEQQYLPQLKSYRQTAQDNIKEARALARAGGDTLTLQSNLSSNQKVIDVIDLYTQVLNDQKNKVQRALKVSLHEQKVADNTYSTVTVSSAVVGMIRKGGDTFAQLISLQMPDVHLFENKEIQREFEKLTQRMKES